MTRLSNISTYRTALMGIAIVVVFLYHSSEATCFGLPVLHYVRNTTHIVDVFMLLSAFGLCYSHKRDGDTAAFVRRRFTRIFPTYWLVIGAYHILSVVTLNFKPEFAQWLQHPTSIVQALYYYSTLGWWAHPLQPHIYYYDWYVPTIVLFYLLFPAMIAFARSTAKAAVLVIASLAFSVVCALLYGTYDGESFLFLSFTRLPVFALGILIFYLKEHHDARRGAVAVALCVALVAILHTPALHFTDRTQVIITSTIVVTLYTTGLSLILALPMRIGLIKRCFDFLGSISLELFLVHIMVIAAVRKFLGWEHWQVCVAFCIGGSSLCRAPGSEAPHPARRQTNLTLHT